MHGRQILITGVSGFIGSRLVAFLNRYYPSCKITGISRTKPKSLAKCTFYSVDLLKQEELTQVVEQVKPEYIFHLAGLVFSYNWDAL